MNRKPLPFTQVCSELFSLPHPKTKPFDNFMYVEVVFAGLRDTHTYAVYEDNPISTFSAPDCLTLTDPGVFTVSSTL
jgi:hypothetical protein